MDRKIEALFVYVWFEHYLVRESLLFLLICSNFPYFLNYNAAETIYSICRSSDHSVVNANIFL